MKQIMISLLIALLTLQTAAQTPNKNQIKGYVFDNNENSRLEAATVTLLNAKDSSKIDLTHSDKNGYFSFINIPPGAYIIHISFVGYKSLTYIIENIRIDSIIEVGIIKLQKTGIGLSAIEVIKQKNKMRTTTDTIEYAADAFMKNNNDQVADLLESLPGIQIDRDGTIHINGEIINTIMINGRVLFSDDPKAIIKNLQAEMLDKIQIINRKGNTKGQSNTNEQSDRKIINLTIKKNRMNMVAGELTSAFGTNNRYAAKANSSQFREKQQLLVYGNTDNINGALDTKSIGGGGAQRNTKAGGAYNAEINNRLQLNLNYSGINTKSQEQKNSHKENIIGDSILLNNQQANTSSNSTAHVLTVDIHYKIDSLQSIRLSNNSTYARSTISSLSNYESATNDSIRANNGQSDNNQTSNKMTASATVYYEKNFLTKGRRLGITMIYTNGKTTARGFNKSNSFYNPGTSNSTSDTINQRNEATGKAQQFFLNINYVEPIYSNGSLIISYSEDHTKSESDLRTFNYDYETRLYDSLDAPKSNSYVNSPIQQALALSYFYQKEKYDYLLSFSLFHNKTSSHDFSHNKNYSLKTMQILPNINFNLNVTSNKAVRFSYRKSVNLPSLSQLQSVVDNSNPMYLIYGNPDLIPSKYHDLNVAYTYFNATTLKNFFFTLNGQFSVDEIINAITLDSIGRQIIKPKNINGGYSLNFNLENGFPLGDERYLFYLITRGTLSRLPNSVNEIKAFNKERAITQVMRLNFTQKKTLYLSLSNSVSYNHISYSSTNSTYASFLSGGISFNWNLHLPMNFSIGSDFQLAWATDRNKEYSSSPILLNAFITKSLFSRNQGQLQLQGFDLLKKNNNISRSIGSNYIEDTRTNILERFLILKFSYFFGKKK